MQYIINLDVEGLKRFEVVKKMTDFSRKQAGKEPISRDALMEKLANIGIQSAVSANLDLAFLCSDEEKLMKTKLN